MTKKVPGLAESIFEEILPLAKAGIKLFDTLPPAGLIIYASGERRTLEVADLFKSSMTKEMVVPVVDLIFSKEKEAIAIAIVAEAWVVTGKLKGFERSLEFFPGRVEGVLISVYCRDHQDKLFALKILEGRKGLSLMENDGNIQEGRLVRDDPRRN